MIQLYSIITHEEPIQSFISNPSESSLLQKITKTFIKKIKGQESKVVRKQTIGQFCLYYFCQQPFTFLLIAKNHERQNRMRNYLRVVADIFYENEDEKKFKFVLTSIIREINRIQSGGLVNMEDEEDSLVGESLLEQKERINTLVKERDWHSKRARYITVLLILGIILLAFYLLLFKNDSVKGKNLTEAASVMKL